MKPVATEIGMNRTGIEMSPLDGKEMVEGVSLGGPVPSGGPELAAEERRSYTEDAPPLGTVPLPTSLRGAARAAADLIRGKAPIVLLDKLAERLAFERTGSRLYAGVLVKVQASESWKGGPTVSELVRYRDEELDHFRLVAAALDELGADPTAVTPGADVIAVSSSGLLQVVADPRTTVAQALEALLAAELVDNDGWPLLIELCKGLGKDEIAQRFLGAQRAELAHLASVRRWLTDEVSLEAHAALAA
jgi:hypothetical protein